MRELALLLLLLGSTRAAAGIPAEQDDCLGCHTDTSQTFDLPSGEKLPLFVDQEAFARSVHGESLRCTDCHADKTSDHATGVLAFKTRREVTKAYYEQCKGCHFANYTKTLDGVHYAVMAKGNDKAALCVDCHGAHDIARPGQPRTRTSGMCSRCHEKEAEVYGRSVHGRASGASPDVPVCTDCHRAHDTTDPRDGALARRTPELCGRCHAEEAKVYAASVHGMAVESSSDVPVCTDCHRAHDTADPREGALAMRTPEICGRCHGDEKLMKKYGLSTHVVDTYLADFHGMAATLQHKADKGSGERLAAVCTDCHGVHDIRKSDDPNSQVMSANLQKTCAKCHPGATANFPAAWLSHYEPTLEKAPLVWGVQLFYRLIIPFMVGGLILQIALHLWRVVVNR
jgi:predicted CXXCH cytochrome family protein